MSKSKVAYFTNIAPHYRENLWLAFVKQAEVEFHFFFGFTPNQSIKSIDFTTQPWKEYTHQLHKTGSIKLKKRLVFQTKVLRQVMFYNWEAIIFLGDPNLISNWLGAIIARVRKIPVLFWGHGIYGKETRTKKIILKSFLSLANLNLVYGQRAKDLLITEGFNENNIKVIYNSLDYQQSKALRQHSLQKDYYKSIFGNNHPTLIFIGRLTKVKKLDKLLLAVHQLKEIGRNFNLMLIGEGTEKKNLETHAKQLKIKTFFYGACYDEQKIATMLANADLCVSPGNVGLTAIHAMSYGTPVCTNDDFNNQMPEYEAITPWITGCFFNAKKYNITPTILQWFQQMPNREKVRQNCYNKIDQYYNPLKQVKILKQALAEVIPNSN